MPSGETDSSGPNLHIRALNTARTGRTGHSWSASCHVMTDNFDITQKIPDGSDIADQLDQQGFARLPDMISSDICDRLAGYFDHPEIAYRSTIDMARYSFGRGTYRYFDYPLPTIIQSLRHALYALLAKTANDWSERLGGEPGWPDNLETLLETCHKAGQKRPTPLILRYGEGDYNCLHQDMYGEIHFPFQAIVSLSRHGEDYTGGELVLVEQRPRQQSRPVVMTPGKGEITIIPVRERPVKGARGWYRTQMRHGVSEVNKGRRVTLGLIFHDAK